MCYRHCVLITDVKVNTNPRELICVTLSSGDTRMSRRKKGFGRVRPWISRWSGDFIAYLVVTGRRRFVRERRWQRRYQDGDVIRWRRWILPYRRRRRHSADDGLADTRRVCQSGQVVLLHASARPVDVLRSTAVVIMALIMTPAKDRVQTCRQ